MSWSGARESQRREGWMIAAWREGAASPSPKREDVRALSSMRETAKPGAVTPRDLDVAGYPPGALLTRARRG